MARPLCRPRKRDADSTRTRGERRPARRSSQASPVGRGTSTRSLPGLRRACSASGRAGTRDRRPRDVRPAGPRRRVGRSGRPGPALLLPCVLDDDRHFARPPLSVPVVRSFRDPRSPSTSPPGRPQGGRRPAAVRGPRRERELAKPPPLAERTPLTTLGLARRVARREGQGADSLGRTRQTRPAPRPSGRGPASSGRRRASRSSTRRGRRVRRAPGRLERARSAGADSPRSPATSGRCCIHRGRP